MNMKAMATGLLIGGLGFGFLALVSSEGRGRMKWAASTMLTAAGIALGLADQER